MPRDDRATPSIAHPSRTAQEHRLIAVELRLSFFDTPRLRPHYASLLRELRDERSALLSSLARPRPATAEILGQPGSGALGAAWLKHQISVA